MIEPANDHEAFVQLFARHEPSLRAFIRASVYDPSAVDEIMQDTSLAAWRKFSTLDDRDLFPRWMCLIAKYEILMYYRRRDRERTILNEGLIECIANEGAEETSRRKLYLDQLDLCLNKLPTDRRELLQAAYAPGASIKNLAARLKRSEGSLYQQLARMRRELLECMRRGLDVDRGAL